MGPYIFPDNSSAVIISLSEYLKFLIHIFFFFVYGWWVREIGNDSWFLTREGSSLTVLNHPKDHGVKLHRVRTWLGCNDSQSEATKT